MSIVDQSEIQGYALKRVDGKFEPWSYHPRVLHDEEVEVKIQYCGICSSDIHTAFQGWGKVELPLIVGHEIVGVISAIGSKVRGFKLGDRVGIGPFSDCCCSQPSQQGETCHACAIEQHNHCSSLVETYSSKYPDGERSQGGYAHAKRVHQRWVFAIPSRLDSASASPLLCAGVTTYTPLKRYKAGPGKHVGVIGIGGLGHLAVQIASKMGAQVIAFGTSVSKREVAIQLGAQEYVNLQDENEMKRYAGKLDLILCTSDMKGQSFAKYFALSALDGYFVMLAVPDEDMRVSAMALCWTRVCVTGSVVGSPAETRETLEFCARHDIRPMIEILPMSQVNEGIAKVRQNQVKFRVVLENEK